MLEQIMDLIDISSIEWAKWQLPIIIGVVALLILLLIILSIRDLCRFVVREYYFCANGLKKNAKLLILSDVHNKQYGKNNQALWNEIELIAPDYILVAGDMITAKKGKNNRPAIELLTMLSVKYPVFYANGNHEKRLMVPESPLYETGEDYERQIEKLPLWRLRNEYMYLPELNMNIFGLDMDVEYYRRFGEEKMSAEYLESVLGVAQKGVVNVLIAHNPEFFRQYAAWGADLVVSGHYHGGVVRLPRVGGLISPRFKLFPQFDGGIFTTLRSTLVVSRGLGNHAIPLRLNNPGELVVIHMRY